MLESGDGSEAIQAAQGILRDLGVNGIPTIVLGGKYQLPSGALGAQTLVEAFRAIEAEGGATGSLFAEALGIPDKVMEETLVL